MPREEYVLKDAPPQRLESEPEQAVDIDNDREGDGADGSEGEEEDFIEPKNGKTFKEREN